MSRAPVQSQADVTKSRKEQKISLVAHSVGQGVYSVLLLPLPLLLLLLLLLLPFIIPALHPPTRASTGYA